LVLVGVPVKVGVTDLVAVYVGVGCCVLELVPVGVTVLVLVRVKVAEIDGVAVGHAPPVRRMLSTYTI